MPDPLDYEPRRVAKPKGWAGIIVVLLIIALALYMLGTWWFLHGPSFP
jgi:hypothetical protein